MLYLSNRGVAIVLFIILNSYNTLVPNLMTDIKEDSEQPSERARRIIAAAEQVVQKKAEEFDRVGTPLRPSREVQLFLDREAGFLSEKSQRLLQAQAYFYERGADTSLSNKRLDNLTDEDDAEIKRALEWLESDYLDYLEPKNEYPAAEEVIKSLK